jgi:hypothetical protein
MDRSLTYISVLIAFLVGCNKVKIEEIPCPAKPHEFCGEQQKRLIDQEWKLDGWTINKSGSEGAKYSAYRDGKLIYSEGQPTHAKWFTQIKTNKFELNLVEVNNEQNEIIVMDDKKEVLYEFVFRNDSLIKVIKVPQDFHQISDTLYLANDKRLN